MTPSFSSQKLSIRPAVERLLKELGPRNRDIIESRFGVARAEHETLESIGKRYGITRERVRQIEEATLTKMRNHPTARVLGPYVEKISAFLETRGGMAREDELLQDLVPASQGPYLSLILHLDESFSRMPETDDFHSLWVAKKEPAEHLQNLLLRVTSRLQSKGKPVAWEDLLTVAKDEASQLPHSFSPDIIARHLAVAKSIQKGPFGNWGLSHWPEINPRGVRDKAYLVLATAEKAPLHFRDIAKRIESLPLEAYGKKKSAHPQTVHNELIKDSRFVLVGRGMYGLLEWGYTPGTVRDVLWHTLAEAKKPLAQEELLGRVLAQRLVQPNTVLINMQNKKYFRQTEDGKYILA